MLEEIPCEAQITFGSNKATDIVVSVIGRVVIAGVVLPREQNDVEYVGSDNAG